MVTIILISVHPQELLELVIETHWLVYWLVQQEMEVTTLQLDISHWLFAIILTMHVLVRILEILSQMVLKIFVLGTMRVEALFLDQIILQLATTLQLQPTLTIRQLLETAVLHHLYLVKMVRIAEMELITGYMAEHLKLGQIQLAQLQLLIQQLFLN